MNPLIFISKPALIVYAVIAAIALYWGWSHHIAKEATAACEASQKSASADLGAKVANIGLNAIEGMNHANLSDAPAVDRAANSVRSACRSVQNSRPSQIPNGSGSQAQDSRESEEWLNDAADDIRTCQAELNRFTALQQERAGLTAVTQEK